MKLKTLKLLEKTLSWASHKLEVWLEEVQWRVITHTPVGPNPCEPGTIEWFLHEEGNRLRAEHRLVAKTLCPWMEIFKNSKP
jgi:hypothetical protein